MSDEAVHLPEDLQRFFNVVLGARWPESSEPGLKALARFWDDLVAALEELEPELADGGSGVLAALVGEVGQALGFWLSKDAPTAAAQLVLGAKESADLAKNAAADVLKSKIMFGVMAALALVTILELVSTLVGALFVGVVEAGARAALAALWRALVTQLESLTVSGAARGLARVGVQAGKFAAIGAGLMGGLDLSIQAGQVLAGDRTKFDTQSLLGSFVGGGLGGAFAGVFHAGALVVRDTAGRLGKETPGYARALGQVAYGAGQAITVVLSAPVVNAATGNAGANPGLGALSAFGAMGGRRHVTTTGSGSESLDGELAAAGQLHAPTLSIPDITAAEPDAGESGGEKPGSGTADTGKPGEETGGEKVSTGTAGGEKAGTGTTGGDKAGYETFGRGGASDEQLGSSEEAAPPPYSAVAALDEGYRSTPVAPSAGKPLGTVYATAATGDSRTPGGNTVHDRTALTDPGATGANSSSRLGSATVTSSAGRSAPGGEATAPDPARAAAPPSYTSVATVAGRAVPGVATVAGRAVPGVATVAGRAVPGIESSVAGPVAVPPGRQAAASVSAAASHFLGGDSGLSARQTTTSPVTTGDTEQPRADTAVTPQRVAVNGSTPGLGAQPEPAASVPHGAVTDVGAGTARSADAHRDAAGHSAVQAESTHVGGVPLVGTAPRGDLAVNDVNVPGAQAGTAPRTQVLRDESGSFVGVAFLPADQAATVAAGFARGAGADVDGVKVLLHGETANLGESRLDRARQLVDRLAEVNRGLSATGELKPWRKAMIVSCGFDDADATVVQDLARRARVADRVESYSHGLAAEVTGTGTLRRLEPGRRPAPGSVVLGEVTHHGTGSADSGSSRSGKSRRFSDATTVADDSDAVSSLSRATTAADDAAESPDPRPFREQLPEYARSGTALGGVTIKGKASGAEKVQALAGKLLGTFTEGEPEGLEAISTFLNRARYESILGQRRFAPVRVGAEWFEVDVRAEPDLDAVTADEIEPSSSVTVGHIKDQDQVTHSATRNDTRVTNLGTGASAMLTGAGLSVWASASAPVGAPGRRHADGTTTTAHGSVRASGPASKAEVTVTYHVTVTDARGRAVSGVVQGEKIELLLPDTLRTMTEPGEIEQTGPVRPDWAQRIEFLMPDVVQVDEAALFSAVTGVLHPSVTKLGAPGRSELRELLTGTGLRPLMRTALSGHPVFSADLASSHGSYRQALRITATPRAAELVGILPDREKVGFTDTTDVGDVTTASAVSGLQVEGGAGGMAGVSDLFRAVGGAVGGAAAKVTRVAKSGIHTSSGTALFATGELGLYKVVTDLKITTSEGHEVVVPATTYLRLGLPEAKAQGLPVPQGTRDKLVPTDEPRFEPPYLPAAAAGGQVTAGAFEPAVHVAKRVENILRARKGFDKFLPDWDSGARPNPAKGDGWEARERFANLRKLLTSFSPTALRSRLDSLLGPGVPARFKRRGLFTNEYVQVRVRAKLSAGLHLGQASGRTVLTTGENRPVLADGATTEFGWSAGAEGRAVLLPSTDAASGMADLTFTPLRYTDDKMWKNTADTQTDRLDWNLGSPDTQVFEHDVEFEIEVTSYTRRRAWVRRVTPGSPLRQVPRVTRVPQAELGPPIKGKVELWVDDAVVSRTDLSAFAPGKPGVIGLAEADTPSIGDLLLEPSSAPRFMRAEAITGAEVLQDEALRLLDVAAKHDSALTLPGGESHSRVERMFEPEALRNQLPRLLGSGATSSELRYARRAADRVGTVATRVALSDPVVVAVGPHGDAETSFVGGHRISGESVRRRAVSAVLQLGSYLRPGAAAGRGQLSAGASWTPWIRGKDKSLEFSGGYERMHRGGAEGGNGRAFLVRYDAAVRMVAEVRSESVVDGSVGRAGSVVHLPGGVFVRMSEAQAREAGLLPAAEPRTPPASALTPPTPAGVKTTGGFGTESYEQAPEVGEFLKDAEAALRALDSSLLSKSVFDDTMNNLRRTLDFGSPQAIAALVDDALDGGADIPLYERGTFTTGTQLLRLKAVPTGTEFADVVHDGSDIDNWNYNSGSSDTGTTRGTSISGSLRLGLRGVYSDADTGSSGSEGMTAGGTAARSTGQRVGNPELASQNHNTSASGPFVRYRQGLRLDLELVRGTDAIRLASKDTVLTRRTVADDQRAPGPERTRPAEPSFTDVDPARVSEGELGKWRDDGLGELPRMTGVAFMRGAGAVRAAAERALRLAGAKPALAAPETAAGAVLAGAFSNTTLRSRLPDLIKAGGELPELHEEKAGGGQHATVRVYSRVVARELAALSDNVRIDRVPRTRRQLNVTPDRVTGGTATANLAEGFVTDSHDDWLTPPTASRNKPGEYHNPAASGTGRRGLEERQAGRTGLLRLHLEHRVVADLGDGRVGVVDVEIPEGALARMGVDDVAAQLGRLPVDLLAAQDRAGRAATRWRAAEQDATTAQRALDDLWLEQTALRSKAAADFQALAGRLGHTGDDPVAAAESAMSKTAAAWRKVVGEAAESAGSGSRRADAGDETVSASQLELLSPATAKLFAMRSEHLAEQATITARIDEARESARASLKRADAARDQWLGAKEAVDRQVDEFNRAGAEAAPGRLETIAEETSEELATAATETSAPAGPSRSGKGKAVAIQSASEVSHDDASAPVKPSRRFRLAGYLLRNRTFGPAVQLGKTEGAEHVVAAATGLGGAKVAAGDVEKLRHAAENEVRGLNAAGRIFTLGGQRVRVQADPDWSRATPVDGDAAPASAAGSWDRRTKVALATGKTPKLSIAYFLPMVPGMFGLGMVNVPTGPGFQRRAGHHEADGKTTGIALPVDAKGGNTGYRGMRTAEVPLVFTMTPVDAEGRPEGPAVTVGAPAQQAGKPVTVRMSVPDGLRTDGRSVPVPAALPAAVLEGAALRTAVTGQYKGKPVSRKAAAGPDVAEQVIRTGRLGSKKARNAVRDLLRPENVEQLLPAMAVSPDQAATGAGWVSSHALLPDGNPLRKLLPTKTRRLQLRAVARQVAYLETIDGAVYRETDTETATSDASGAVTRDWSTSFGAGPGFDVGFVSVAGGPTAGVGLSVAHGLDEANQTGSERTTTRTAPVVRYRTTYDLEVRFSGRPATTFADALDGYHWTSPENAARAGITAGEDGAPARPVPREELGHAVATAALELPAASELLSSMMRESAHTIPGHHRWKWRDTTFATRFDDPKFKKGLSAGYERQLGRTEEIEGAVSGENLARRAPEMLTDQPLTVELEPEPGRGHDYHAAFRVAAALESGLVDLGPAEATPTADTLAETTRSTTSATRTRELMGGVVGRVYSALAGGMALATGYSKVSRSSVKAVTQEQSTGSTGGGVTGSELDEAGAVRPEPMRRYAARVRLTVSGTHWSRHNDLVRAVTPGAPGKQAPTVHELKIVDPTAAEQGRRPGTVVADVVLELPASRAAELGTHVEPVGRKRLTEPEMESGTELRRGLSRDYDGIRIVSLNGAENVRESVRTQLLLAGRDPALSAPDGENSRLIDQRLSERSARTDRRFFSRPTTLTGFRWHRRRANAEASAQVSHVLRDPEVLDTVWQQPDGSITTTRTTGQSKTTGWHQANALEPAWVPVGHAESHALGLEGHPLGLLLAELHLWKGGRTKGRSRQTSTETTTALRGEPKRVHLVKAGVESTVQVEVRHRGNLDRWGLKKAKTPRRAGEQFTQPGAALVLATDEQLERIRVTQAAVDAWRATGDETAVAGAPDAPGTDLREPFEPVPAGHRLGRPRWADAALEPVDLSGHIVPLREALRRRLGQEVAERLLPVSRLPGTIDNTSRAEGFLSHINAALTEAANGGSSASLRLDGLISGETYDLVVGAELSGPAVPRGIEHADLTKSGSVSVTDRLTKSFTRVLAELVSLFQPAVMLQSEQRLAGAEAHPGLHGAPYGDVGFGFGNASEWLKQTKTVQEDNATGYTQSERVQGGLAAHSADVLFDVRIERNGERIVAAPDVRTVTTRSAVEDVVPDAEAAPSPGEIVVRKASDGDPAALAEWHNAPDVERLPALDRFRAVDFRGDTTDLVRGIELGIEQVGAGVDAQTRRMLRSALLPTRLTTQLPTLDSDGTQLEVPPQLGVKVFVHARNFERAGLNGVSDRIRMTATRTHTGGRHTEIESETEHAVLALPFLAAGVPQAPSSASYADGRQAFGGISDWVIPIEPLGGRGVGTEQGESSSYGGPELPSADSLAADRETLTSLWGHGTEFRIVVESQSSLFGRRAVVDVSFDRGYEIRRGDRADHVPGPVKAAATEFAVRDAAWTAARALHRAKPDDEDRAASVAEAEAAWWRAKARYDRVLAAARQDPALSGRAPTTRLVVPGAAAELPVQQRSELLQVARAALDIVKAGKRPVVRYRVRGDLGSGQAARDFTTVGNSLTKVLALAQTGASEAQLTKGDAGMATTPHFVPGEGATQVEIWVEAVPLRPARDVPAAAAKGGVSGADTIESGPSRGVAGAEVRESGASKGGDPGLDTMASFLAPTGAAAEAFAHPDAWAGLRAAAPVEQVQTERFDPAKKAADGWLTRIGYESRRIEHAPGQWVRELTVRLHTRPVTPDVTAADIERVQKRLVNALDRNVNGRHRLRNGDQLHLRAEFGTFDPATGNLRYEGPIHGTAHLHTGDHTDQSSWSVRAEDFELLDEHRHYLGLRERYTDGDALFRPTGSPRTGPAGSALLDDPTQLGLSEAERTYLDDSMSGLRPHDLPLSARSVPVPKHRRNEPHSVHPLWQDPGQPWVDGGKAGASLRPPGAPKRRATTTPDGESKRPRYGDTEPHPVRSAPGNAYLPNWGLDVSGNGLWTVPSPGEGLPLAARMSGQADFESLLSDQIAALRGAGAEPTAGVEIRDDALPAPPRSQDSDRDGSEVAGAPAGGKWDLANREDHPHIHDAASRVALEMMSAGDGIPGKRRVARRLLALGIVQAGQFKLEEFIEDDLIRVTGVRTRSEGSSDVVDRSGPPSVTDADDHQQIKDLAYDKVLRKDFVDKPFDPANIAPTFVAAQLREAGLVRGDRAAVAKVIGDAVRRANADAARQRTAADGTAGPGDPQPTADPVATTGPEPAAIPAGLSLAETRELDGEAGGSGGQDSAPVGAMPEEVRSPSADIGLLPAFGSPTWTEPSWSPEISVRAEEVFGNAHLPNWGLGDSVPGLWDTDLAAGRPVDAEAETWPDLFYDRAEDAAGTASGTPFQESSSAGSPPRGDGPEPIAADPPVPAEPHEPLPSIGGWDDFAVIREAARTESLAALARGEAVSTKTIAVKLMAMGVRYGHGTVEEIIAEAVSDAIDSTGLLTFSDPAHQQKIIDLAYDMVVNRTFRGQPFDVNNVSATFISAELVDGGSVRGNRSSIGFLIKDAVRRANEDFALRVSRPGEAAAAPAGEGTGRGPARRDPAAGTG
ncbi:hypothetical protein [Amycolatopsis sp. WQ 127309]|uniref:WXG100-like domain-containing protein n=1 Tax=Amycolatopsis sp. WQ 127309 TaxID=2932773 RepID=UPI001FF2B6E2|nr:hypothetical protein [Amycolatopsis sp. WQ 127309]UOZ06955.1 hypothetical protein MUY22_01270 [Amycolatopsis sp. WQ 127309]